MVFKFARFAAALAGSGILAAGCSSLASASTWNLKSDWSNVSNPNGPWSLNQGSTPLPLVSNFTAAGTSPIPAQPAWAPSNNAGNFLPLFFQPQATATGYDWAVGDVVVHSQDYANGPSNGFANITWTAPFAGTASLAGDLWEIRNIGRANTWTLFDGATVLATNTLTDGDGHGSSNPETFSQSNIAVTTGTVFTLEIVETSSNSLGELAGLNFTVTDVPNGVPEPSTFAMMVFGFAGLGYAAWRNTRKTVACRRPSPPTRAVSNG